VSEPLIELFPISVSERLADNAQATLLEGDTLETLKTMADGSVKLVVTSPPYNIGKEYETAVELEHYLDWLKPVIAELHRVLHPEGNVAWQVGNFIDDGEVFPLDIWFYPIFKKLGFKLRNRIVWHCVHCLHANSNQDG
jgi:adenine-specific DNA-methyltransferase